VRSEAHIESLSFESEQYNGRPTDIQAETREGEGNGKSQKAGGRES
jgi:hypothetical protein